MEKLMLKYLGVDSWSRDVFENEEGKLFKDVSCGIGQPEYCTTYGGFDGEPDTPIQYIKRYKDLEIEITGKPEEPTKEEKFNYMMLSRLESDCKYYLGNGNRNPKQLWALDEKDHIQEMKKIYDSFTEDKKPEWLTLDEILDYEKQMVI